MPEIAFAEAMRVLRGSAMGSSMLWHVILCAIVPLCLSSRATEAEPPGDVLRAAFGDANTILTDPGTEQHLGDRLVAIRALFGRVFDFRDAAERSLGSQWQANSMAERSEFTRLFTEFMQRGFVYWLASVAEVSSHGAGVTVHFLRESLDRETATVQVAVVGRGGRLIPLSHDLVPRPALVGA
jgi:ABC-type transporter MlaC component